MTDILDKTKLQFADLGVSTGQEIAGLFNQLIKLAEIEQKEVLTEKEREEFRVRWLGRNNSVRTRVKRNWLEAAPKEMRRWVGTYFNTLSEKLENDFAHIKLAAEILWADE